jgi:ATP-dependent DNA ligase
MKKELRIGTWNASTLCKRRELKQLEKMLQDYTVRKENKKTNYVASVQEQITPTERPSFVVEVSANFCEKMGVA